MFDRLAQQFGIGPLGRTRLGLAEITRRVLADELRDNLGMPDLRPVLRPVSKPDDADAVERRHVARAR